MLHGGGNNYSVPIPAWYNHNSTDKGTYHIDTVQGFIIKLMDRSRGVHGVWVNLPSKFKTQ